MQWIYSIQLLFFIITSFLYVIVLISLYQSWRARVAGFNIAFSKLCFVTGICDLSKYFLISDIFQILPYSNPHNQQPILCTTKGLCLSRLFYFWRALFCSYIPFCCLGWWNLSRPLCSYDSLQPTLHRYISSG